MAAYPRKSPGSPAGDLVKAQNVVIIDSEDETIRQYGSWNSVAAEDAAGLTYLQSNITGASIEYKFVGTAVWLRYFAGTNKGRANVYIDDEGAKTLEMFSETARPRMSWLATNLAPGIMHKVRVEVAGTKHTNSSGYNVTVDTFVVELSAGALQTWVMIEEGVPVTLSLPREKIVFTDDFEPATLMWLGDGTGSVSRDTTDGIPFSKGACMKITTGATSGDYYKGLRCINALLSKRMGVEYWLKAPTPQSNLWVHVEMWILDGTNRIWGDIRYNFQDQKLYYLDADGTFHEFPEDPEYAQWDVRNWVHAKLVIDFDTRKYVYFVIGDKYVDLSDIPLYVESNTNAPQLFISFYAWTRTNAARTIYIDEVKVTTDEP